MSGPTQPVSVSLDVSAVPSRPVGVGRFALDLVRVLASREDVVLTLWCRRDAPGGGSMRAGRGSTYHTVPPRPLRRPDRLAPRANRRRRCGRSHPRLGRCASSGSSFASRGSCPVLRWRSITARTTRCRSSRLAAGRHDPRPHLLRPSRVAQERQGPGIPAAIRVAARRATALLCDSGRTAARLQELCHPEGRVFVVPLGVDTERFRPTSPQCDGAGTS